LYPGNHKLVIKEEQDKFMVQLEIVLKK
jgi:hypothetical protein